MSYTIRQFSVTEYHRLSEIGILTDEDKVELLEGYVMLKMLTNPPHDGTLDLLTATLPSLVPSGWVMRMQQAITLADSEPEPDFAIVRGNKRSYFTRHPGSVDIGLVVEVAHDSLDRDSIGKSRIYARAGIAIYWVVNLIDMRLEVRTVPGVVNGQPAYTQVQHYSAGDAVPLILDGVASASIPVRELLP